MLRECGQFCPNYGSVITAGLLSRGSRVRISAGECFLHCAKAFRRSHLWAHEQWPEPAVLPPSPACVLFDQIKPQGVTLEDYERDIEEAYAKRLY